MATFAAGEVHLEADAENNWERRHAHIGCRDPLIPRVCEKLQVWAAELKSQTHVISLFPGAVLRYDDVNGNETAGAVSPPRVTENSAGETWRCHLKNSVVNSISGREVSTNAVTGGQRNTRVEREPVHPRVSLQHGWSRLANLRLRENIIELIERIFEIHPERAVKAVTDSGQKVPARVVAAAKAAIGGREATPI